MAAEKPEKKDKKGILTPAEFYKKIGKEDKSAVLDLKNQKKMDFISTGSWVINSLIGDGSLTGKPGGFPRGAITEIVGDESAGKSTLLLSGIREAQALNDGPCVLLDFEQTFHKDYTARLGVDVDPNKLIVFQPMHFQQGARMINDALRMKPAIIGVDSVSAMTPLQVLEGSVDETARIGLLAQLMSAFLTYISKFLKDSNTALVFTNQLRQVINTGWVAPGAPTEESTGGKSLKYYSSLRIMMKKGKVEKVEQVSNITGKKEKEPVNVISRVSIIKNKIDKPFRAAPTYIKFGVGFDNILSIIELAINLDVIKRMGNMYVYSHGKEKLIEVLGKKQLWETLNSNEKLFKRLQDSLVIGVDEQIQREFKEDSEAGGVDEMDALLNNVGNTFVEKKNKKKKAKEEAEDVNVDLEKEPEDEESSDE
jgi:recombination protein RecA